MSCYHHPDREEAARCSACGRPLCRECSDLYDPPLCGACGHLYEGLPSGAQPCPQCGSLLKRYQYD